MKNKTVNKRASKRPMRMTVAALGLGLMASLVPLATSQATAQVLEGELKAGEVLFQDRPSLHECVELVNELGGFKGPVISRSALPYLDQTPPTREDDQQRDPAEIASLKDRYRELGCASIPGFPTL